MKITLHREPLTNLEYIFFLHYGNDVWILNFYCCLFINISIIASKITNVISGGERQYEDWRIYMVANRVGTGKTFVALDDFAFRNITVLVFVSNRFIIAH